MAADKTLLIKLKVSADGAEVVGFGRTLDQVTASESRLRRSMAETNSEAKRGKENFGELTGKLKEFLLHVAEFVALEEAARKIFEYNQSLEESTNSVAGLLLANRQYVDATGRAVDMTVAWSAANVEAGNVVESLRLKALRTAATVPQMSDAFATVYSTLHQMGQSTADLEKVALLTTRIVQTASVFHLPVGELQSQINALITGIIRPEAILPRRLGYTSEDVKRLQATNKLVDDILQRTKAFEKPAEKAAQTVSGKLINTREAVLAALSRASEPIIEKMKGVLDAIFNVFANEGNANALASWVSRLVGAFDRGVAAIESFGTKHRKLLEDIAAVGVFAGVAVAGYSLIMAAIAALESPITIAIVSIVALAFAWEKLSEYSEIKVKGLPIATWMRATFAEVVAIAKADYATIIDVTRVFGLTLMEVGAIAGATTRLFAATMIMIGKIAGAIFAIVVAPFKFAFDLLATVVSFAFDRMRSLVKIGEATTRIVSASVSPLATIVTSVTTTIEHVVETFMAGMSVIVNPLRRLASMAGDLLLKIPGAAEVKKAAGDLFAALGDFSPLKNVKTEFDNIAKVYKDGEAEIEAALKTKGPIVPKPSELLTDLWGKAKTKLDQMLPQLEESGKKALAGLLGVHGVANDTRKLTEQQQKQLDEFKSHLKAMEVEASGAVGDPLVEKLAGFEKKRVEEIEKAHRAAAESLGAIDEELVKRAEELQNKIAKNSISQAINEKQLEITKRITSLQRELELDAQKDIDTDRLALIHDELQKELEQNRNANREWAQEKRSSIQQFYNEQIQLAERSLAALEKIDADWARAAAAELRTSIATMRKEENKELDTVDADRARRDQVAKDRYLRNLKEQTAGTVEFAQKIRDTLVQQFGKIGEIISRSIIDSRSALASAINGWLDDFGSGQSGLMKALGGLAQQMGQTWTKMLTSILMNGQGVMKQLTALWNNFVVRSPNGGVDTLGTVLNGAGVGAMIGGLFQKPGNYAGIGGTLGGGIGAAIGMYFGAPQVGALIGTAIGTAIGSMFTKGSDWISVAITHGVVTVTEKGISADARNKLQVEVTRQLHDSLKGWSKIMQLFPDYVQDIAKQLVKPVDLNPFGTNKTVEEGDINDQQALGALGDFLSNDLPNATYKSYESAINKALSLVGVGANKIKELAKYWGTLQGKELQSAVADYVSTMMDAVNIRDKFKLGFGARLDDARKPNTVLDQLDDLDSKMALAVASMAKLTDIDDQIAAQKEINNLGQQRLELERQILQQIDAQERSIHESNSSLREQISVSGMDDQGKINFFYKRLADLRETMSRATDPAEITRLNQEMQGYIQQAFGLAGDNPENRTKLMQIIDDMDTLASQRMEAVRNEIAARDEKPATLLEKAAQMLMNAADDLSGVAPKNPEPPGSGPTPPGGKTPNPPGGGIPIPEPSNPNPIPPIPNQPGDYGIEVPPFGSTLAATAAAIRAARDDMRQMIERRDAITLQQEKLLALPTAAAVAADPDKIAKAVRDALDGMQMKAAVDLDGTVDFDAGRLRNEVSSFTIQLIRDNPHIISSRSRG